MRQYFFSLLQSLKKLTGLKQWETLAAIEDPEVRKREINELLDVLERTAAAFPMIPEADQQAFINQAVLSESEFTSLNARFIYKCLYAHHEKYNKPEGKKDDKDWVPLTGEARQEKLKEWAKSLSGFEEKIGGKSHVQLLEESLPPKDKGVTYHAPKMTPEEFARQEMKRELHTQYIRENYETLTAKPLPTWVNEQEWLRKQLLLDNPEATEEQIQEFINALR